MVKCPKSPKKSILFLLITLFRPVLKRKYPFLMAKIIDSTRYFGVKSKNFARLRRALQKYRSRSTTDLRGDKYVLSISKFHFKQKIL